MTVVKQLAETPEVLVTLEILATPETPPMQNLHSCKGDSLWRIANNHKVTVANLKAWNNLKSDFIYPGQKLKVSAGSTTSDTNTSKPSTGTSTSKPSTGTSTNAKVYTVVKVTRFGESLTTIK